MAAKPCHDMPHTPPAFSPQNLVGLYLNGRHDDLSEALLIILRHFRDTTYTRLEAQGAHFLNAFIKQFLALFTQADYTPRRDHLVEFIRLNLTLSNLAAMSSIGTTDGYLSLLDRNPAHLGKLLTVLSARNTAHYDHASFFDADPVLASVWYGAYAGLYRSGLLRTTVSERLKAHLAFVDERLDPKYCSLELYFASSYINNRIDRNIKKIVNCSIERDLTAASVQIRNQPAPRKIVILSGNWVPTHSVYRVTFAFAKALADAGYDLTFVPLNRRADMDLSLFRDVRPVKTSVDGLPDVTPLQDNEFMVAYYPDVGLTHTSIWLANLRIAPIQVASLGHSVSTFGSQIDYMVSGAAAEPVESPGRNYSERLVLLPGSGAVHNRPCYVPTGRRKKSSEVLINGSWNAQKINSRFCRTLRALLKQSRRAIRLRIFVSASLNRHNNYLPFVRDLEAALGQGSFELISVIPYADYMSLMEEADFALDAFPFGGCNTVADNLYLRKLTVTLEGDRWPGRIGPAMLRAIALPELATTSEHEYLDVALKLIHDDAFRACLQDRLDRADLDATIFSTADAALFPKAVAYLVANHDRLRVEKDRSPIRIGP